MILRTQLKDCRSVLARHQSTEPLKIIGRAWQRCLLRDDRWMRYIAPKRNWDFLISTLQALLLVSLVLATSACSDSVTGVISKDGKTGGVIQLPSESPKYLSGVAETNQVNMLEGMVLDVRFGFSAPSPIDTEITWTITRPGSSGFSGLWTSFVSLFSQDFVNESGTLNVAKDQSEFGISLERVSLLLCN